MLLLLNDVRKKLLRCWALFAGLVIVLMLVQELNGVFQGAKGVPWLWAAICLLPGLGILLTSAILNLNPGKHIWRPVFQVIMAITIVYLLFVVLTLLGMRARAEEQSLIGYFQTSFYRPGPGQLLVLAVYGLLFFRRETAFIPNESIIRNYAEKPLAEAKASHNLAQQAALELFIEGDYTALFPRLRAHFDGKDGEATDTMVLLEGQYKEVRKQRDLGTISPEEAARAMSRIAMALLPFIRKI